MAGKAGWSGRAEGLKRKRIGMPEAANGIEPALEWLRRQGHRLIISPSACWYDAAGGVFQAFPYNRVIAPSPDELRDVFKEGRAYGLRYSAPLTSPAGKISYHIVYSKPVYGLDQVSRQTRQNIRKGIEYAAIEPISFTRLAEEGWSLRAETLTRQSRIKAENAAWWKRLCLSAEGLPGFEAWGASRDGKLVAALIAYLAGDCFVMLYQQSLTQHLRFGVNNALGFVFTQNALARPGVKRLFYGFESLDASWRVDEFKLRMGYTAEPVRQRVVFHPALRPLVKPATLAVLDYLGGKVLRSPRWNKAAGMMRFCLEGDRPLSEQDFPECLLHQRKEWLGKTP
jgi:hypothetical protein